MAFVTSKGRSVMIRSLCLTAILLLSAASASAAEPPAKPVLTGLKAPQLVAAAIDGKVEWVDHRRFGLPRHTPAARIFP